MQTLSVEVPQGFLIVKEEMMEDLISKQFSGKVWSMSDLEKHVGRSNDWLKENILYPYRNELKEFVTYPKKQGQRWRFGALKMSEWLEENMEVVL